MLPDGAGITSGIVGQLHLQEFSFGSILACPSLKRSSDTVCFYMFY